MVVWIVAPCSLVGGYQIQVPVSYTLKKDRFI
jgi:hypothetical protein